MSRVEYRDETIATALRALDVPEHAPGFFEQLERTLADQAPPPRHRARPPRARLRWALRGAVAAGVAAAVLVLAVSVADRGAQPATAAEVTARAQAALDAVRTLSGRLTYTAVEAPGGDLVTRRARFALDDRGSVRLTWDDGEEQVAYDDALGVERAVAISASMGEGTFHTELRGVAPGPPDHEPASGFLARPLAAAVQALAAAGDDRVDEVTYDGRPAWRLAAAVAPNAIAADADRLEVTVDRATGLPVRVRASLAGAVRQELRLDRLVVDQPLAADAFRPAAPDGAEVARTDAGFRGTSLDEARAVVGYAPLVPRSLPAGYGLSRVAVAREAEATAAGRNPPSRRVVSAVYRRGLASLTVTTRRAGTGRWIDPFAVPGVSQRAERVRLTAGALAGAEAHVVLDPRGVPHLWARHDGLVVTIAGDLGREELLAVASSLAARP